MAFLKDRGTVAVPNHHENCMRSKPKLSFNLLHLYQSKLQLMWVMWDDQLWLELAQNRAKFPQKQESNFPFSSGVLQSSLIHIPHVREKFLTNLNIACILFIQTAHTWVCICPTYRLTLIFATKQAASVCEGPTVNFLLLSLLINKFLTSHLHLFPFWYPLSFYKGKQWR